MVMNNLEKKLLEYFIKGNNVWENGNGKSYEQIAHDLTEIAEKEYELELLNVRTK